MPPYLSLLLTRRLLLPLAGPIQADLETFPPLLPDPTPLPIPDSPSVAAAIHWSPCHRRGQSRRPLASSRRGSASHCLAEFRYHALRGSHITMAMTANPDVDTTDDPLLSETVMWRVPALVLLLILPLLDGCAGLSSTQQRMLTGTALGAAAGAGVSALAGGAPLVGAVLGGVGGAATGYT